MKQRKTREASGAAPYHVICSADAEPERWLKERGKYITATDVPSVLGIPGARDALETWYQKKDALLQRAESDAIREAKAAGHAFEDSNAEMFGKRALRRVHRSQELMVSDDYPWLSATVDFIQSCTRLDKNRDPYTDTGPLETKNAGSYAAEEMWPLGGEPHLTWQLQLQTQLMVMRASFGSLSAWLGSPFVHHRWQDFDFDTELAAIVAEETEVFFKSLKRKMPPTTLGNPAVALKVLQRLSPATATRKVISLPKEAATIDARIQSMTESVDKLKQAHDRAKKQLDEERGKIAALVGFNDGGKLPSGVVWTFKHVHVNGHTVQPYSYRALNRTTPSASKPRKTTWKTSK